MELIDVVRKLVGPIIPVGETNCDDERFENLKALTLLVDKLVGDIDIVSTYDDRTESSIVRAVKYADQFLREDLGIG